MTSPNAAGGYRADIDGLRAFAVLAVILFHINPQWLPGGFVGVDIFFVISGYLITGILAKEFEEGTFSFRRFYERRIRRILPALWLLLIACVPVSWWLMLPADAEPMGKSALWSTLAMANVYFWREVSTDYFAPQSSQFPFLHLWSLGVEEQYYVLWPVILIAVWRFKRSHARGFACTLALLLVAVSTLLAEWLLATGEARFAYYMLPARAGELALGAALALIRLPRAIQHNATVSVQFAAATGWGLLAYSLVALSEHDAFPGLRALLPTAGAAALILSGRLIPHHWGLAPLRWSPVVWVGRCSYSAYLWHWPILAWWRYLWRQPDTISGLALLAFMLLLARASQRWVEDPLRRAHTTFSRTLWLVGIAPAIVIVTMGLLAARGDRWGVLPYSSSERQSWSELEGYVRPSHRVDWVCQQHILDPAILTDPKCEFGSGPGPAQVLLLGDSHAGEFAPLFRFVAEEQGFRMRSVALGSCALLAGSLKGVVADWRLDACQRGVPQLLARARDFPVLLIGGAWTGYAHRDPAVWQRLELQLRELTAQGHRIGLLPSVPEFADYDADCPAKQVRVGSWLKCPAVLTPSDIRADANARLAAIASRVSGVVFLPLHRALCTGDHCPVSDSQGRYLYADESHLSVHGALHLADKLTQAGQMPDLRDWLSQK